MKDTEKDGIVDRTPETDVPETEEQNNNVLEIELNKLKDLFQQELDKAASGEYDEETGDGELIQQLDETEHSEDQSADEDRPICQCCKEMPSSDKYGKITEALLLTLSLFQKKSRHSTIKLLTAKSRMCNLLTTMHFVPTYILNKGDSQ